MPPRPRRNLPSVNYSDFPASLNLIDDEDSSDAFQSSVKKTKTKEKKKTKNSSQQSTKTISQAINESADSDEIIIVVSGPPSPKITSPLKKCELTAPISVVNRNKDVNNVAFEDDPYTSELTDVEELPSLKLNLISEKKPSLSSFSSETHDEVDLLKKGTAPQKRQQDVAVENNSSNSTLLTKISSAELSSKKNLAAKSSLKESVLATHPPNKHNKEISLITQGLKDNIDFSLVENKEKKWPSSGPLSSKESSTILKLPPSEPSTTKPSLVNHKASRPKPPVRKTTNPLPGKTLVELLGRKNKNRPLPCSGLFYSSEAPPLHPLPGNPSSRNN